MRASAPQRLQYNARYESSTAASADEEGLDVPARPRHGAYHHPPRRVGVRRGPGVGSWPRFRAPTVSSSASVLVLASARGSRSRCGGGVHRIGAGLGGCRQATLPVRGEGPSGAANRPVSGLLAIGSPPCSRKVSAGGSRPRARCAPSKASAGRSSVAAVPIACAASQTATRAAHARRSVGRVGIGQGGRSVQRRRLRHPRALWPRMVHGESRAAPRWRAWCQPTARARAPAR